MSQYDSKVQNLFLSQLRKKHQKIEVVLETGNVLRGKLKSYDQFSITLSFKDQIEIVYKSSIIYITAIPTMPEKKPFRGTPRGSYSRPYREDYEGDRPYRDRAYRSTPPGYGEEDDDEDGSQINNNSYYRKPYRRDDGYRQPQYNRQDNRYDRQSPYDRQVRQDRQDRPYRPINRKPDNY